MMSRTRGLKPEDTKWVQAFFEQKEGAILTDDDVISLEESDRRIIACQFVMYFVAFLMVHVLFSFAFPILISKPNRVVVRPNVQEKDAFWRNFSLPHLAVIFEDGAVYDWSLHSDKSPSRGKMIKLPKSSKYHGYSDDKGILYFIDGEIRRPATKVHPSLNDLGHLQVPFKPVYDQQPGMEESFDYAVSVGHYFWLMFASSAMGHFFSTPFYHNEKTYVWAKKKEKALQGPSLPNDLMTYSMPKFCSTSINRTHIMVIAFHPKVSFKDDPDHGQPKKNAIVDFQQQKWIQVAPLDFSDSNLNLTFNGCQATMIFKKNDYDRQIIVHLHLHNDLHYANIDRIQRYDLSTDQWTIIQEFPLMYGNAEKACSMVNVQGIAYSVMSNGSLIEHSFNEDGSNYTANPHAISSSNRTVVNAILFYA